jgi:glycosyltransferase involved in cell wall biosynthesis
LNDASELNLGIYHPSFGTVGGAELLAVAEARVLRHGGVNAHIITATVAEAQWRDELRDIPVQCYTKPSALRAFPWTTSARARSEARAAQPLFRGTDVVIAHNYPCNMILGAAECDAVRLWQVNEPSRSLYLPQTNAMLTERVRTLGDSATDWLTRTYAVRLQKWEQRLERGGKLVSKRKLDTQMTARLDGLYAISHYAQEMARRVYGRCSEQIVYPAVRNSIKPAPVRRGVRRSSLQLLVQSRLEPIKNVETVLRGFAAFARAEPNARLHVVGEGTDRERLQTLANELSPGSVVFHSFLDTASLERLAAECDVFALLPVDEPFGMVFTEAMTRGLLCIGPDHGGPSEILNNGELGWCVDAFSPRGVTDALDAIVLMSDDDADARRAEALLSVQQRFSDDAMLQSLRAVLREHDIVI